MAGFRLGIAFEELTLRLYHTCLLHDLGWTTTVEGLTHPAHAMTFELHDAFMVYEHLHAVAPAFDAEQVGDIVQSITLHTSQWSSGNSSATGLLMALTVAFDAFGYDSPGPGGLNYSLLFNTMTVQEIEEHCPRNDFFVEGSETFERESTEKPKQVFCLSGGLDALLKGFLVGPIVPKIVPEESRARNVWP
ncbi:hypothetical protein MVEN_00847400 [Mycena venus]|uniref:HD domain-containing protein n=1 Tax=Mycena venus TaxID=2733690 RepID=A0A8H6YFF8_9AGAR|nr:hypothetical protein MVEN_00847400 [Mycena venus]